MERTRNNVFSAVDCWWLWKEPVVYSILALKNVGFSLADSSKWCPFVFMHAYDRFLHWPTPHHFDVFNNAWPCVIDALHQVAGVTAMPLCLVQCTHIPTSVAKFCSRPSFRVNRTVWRTQIWRDKIRCSLLKELNCFTSIEWCQKPSFPSQLFKCK